MNRKKESFEDYSLSTQEKYVKQAYSRFWDDEIEIVLRDGTGQTVRVYLGMMQAIRMADGYLTRGGEPISSLEIARKLNITQREAGQALRDLKKLRIFSQTPDNVYYSPRMVALFRKGTTTDEKSQEANFPIGNFHEGDSEKQTSPVRMRLELDKTSSDESYSNLFDTNCKEGSSRAGARLPFTGLTSTDLDRVRAKYPAVFAEYYDKFVEVHTQRGTHAVTLKHLYGWCKHLAKTGGTSSKFVEGSMGTADTPATPTASSAVVAAVEDMEEIIIQ
jgi:hypothetical protein